MIRQYMPSFAVSLVSDGFNIWNAICNLWPCEAAVGGGASMREMIRQRLAGKQLSLVHRRVGCTAAKRLTGLRWIRITLFRIGSPPCLSIA